MQKDLAHLQFRLSSCWLIVFFSRVEHSWSCFRCRKTLHIYNGGLWQWDSYEQWTDRRINQHRWFEVQSLKYTYNRKISFSPITEGQSFFDISNQQCTMSKGPLEATLFELPLIFSASKYSRYIFGEWNELYRSQLKHEKGRFELCKSFRYLTQALEV